MSRRPLTTSTALAGLLMVASGCGSSGMVPVKGTVTIDGKPMPAGSLAFQPVDPNVGRPAVVQVQNGEFTVSTLKPSDGLAAGEYRIAVMPPLASPIPGEVSGPEVKVPTKYQDGATSGLKIVVGRGDPAQNLQLDLQSD